MQDKMNKTSYMSAHNRLHLWSSKGNQKNKYSLHENEATHEGNGSDEKWENTGNGRRSCAHACTRTRGSMESRQVKVTNSPEGQTCRTLTIAELCRERDRNARAMRMRKRMEAASGQVNKESWSLAKDSGSGLQSESKHSDGRVRRVRAVGRDMPRVVASNKIQQRFVRCRYRGREEVKYYTNICVQEWLINANR